MNPNSEKYGGFDVGEINKKEALFVSDKRTAKMSYRIHDLDYIGGSEILKLSLKDNGNICRIMKFVDSVSEQPALMFDIVNDERKEIVFKSKGIYYNAMGISAVLAINNLITQWEVVPTDLICRSFLFGDRNTFLDTIEKYNIKISRGADWHIRNELD